MAAGGQLGATACGIGLVADPLRVEGRDGASEELAGTPEDAARDVPTTTSDAATSDVAITDAGSTDAASLDAAAIDVPTSVDDGNPEGTIRDAALADVVTLVEDAATADIRNPAGDDAASQDASTADSAGADTGISRVRQSGIALAGGAGWSGIDLAVSNGDGTFRTTHIEAAELARLAAIPGVTLISGDFDGDGRWDLALIQGPNSTDLPWNVIPIAFARRDGSYELSSRIVLDFPDYARQAGAKPVSGDFDRDGKWDLALTGGWIVPGISWNTVPVAFSRGDGSFQVTNRQVFGFPASATQPGATPMSGDFNGDGKQDIALTGGSTSDGQPWFTLPIAFSNGDGSFVATNLPADDFPLIAALPGAKPVTGDFNGDGRWDIAVTGGTDPDGSLWNTLPVALSYGDGTFLVLNVGLPSFPALASAPGARPLAGDFDGDGQTDLALVGGHDPAGDPWTTIPVAFSRGDGSFRSANLEVGAFAASAASPGVQSVPMR